MKALIATAILALAAPMMVQAQDTEECFVNGVQVACYNPDAVIYPDYSDAYIWDPTVGIFFFWAGGYRHYMGHGWEYGRGVPRGYFHGNRAYGGPHGGGYRGGISHGAPHGGHGHR